MKPRTHFLLLWLAAVGLAVLMGVGLTRAGEMSSPVPDPPAIPYQCSWIPREFRPATLAAMGMSPPVVARRANERDTCEPTITVTSAGDNGPGTLRQALGDVCDGGRIDFSLPPSSTITLTTGQLTVTRSLTLDGSTAVNLTISGNYDSPVMDIAEAIHVTLQDLTIAEGYADYEYGEYVGGIHSRGVLAINNVTIRDNHCHGGRMVCTGWAGLLSWPVLTVTHSLISDNDVDIGQALGASGVVTIRDSTFSGNSEFALGSWGKVTVGNSFFLDNEYGIHNGGALTVNASTFSGNTRDGLSNSGTLTATNSTFSSNGRGAAILEGGVGFFSRNTFNGNTNYDVFGGGICSVGTLTLSNNTISGNTADHAGGIYVEGEASVYNTTITGNSGRLEVGGIYKAPNASLYLYNTIVANSLLGTDCHAYFGGLAANVNNLIEDGSCEPAFSGDPELGPLQDNGGPTWTHKPLPGSPVIDQGYNPTCTAPPVSSQDQRGGFRPVDGDGDGVATCDIGAVEWGAPTQVSISRFQASRGRVGWVWWAAGLLVVLLAAGVGVVLAR
ncbi:MAG: choice-of-anchor Q domain-containing protein [Chloroflexota bacterium]